jgi:uncharacterized protein (TIGR02452 family)
MQFTIGTEPYSWDHAKWLKEFRAPDNKKKLRAEVFQHTVSIVKNGSYYCTKTEKVNLNPNPGIVDKTVYYTKPRELDLAGRFEKTDISVKNADCLVAAKQLLVSGLNPAVLNMANRQIPGGGVFNGAGAQEENIFRRSNLFSSLYQFADFSERYSIRKNIKYQYPLDRNTGGIYSPDITVFRGMENDGYCLLQEPYRLSIVTVPAINSPKLELIDGEYRITKSLIEPTKLKIRTILRIAAQHNHDSIVLSAFGCGAFRNPPKHMAELFHSVFLEKEFINKFKVIVFAIISDHHSGKAHNPEGNLKPFEREFE